MKDKVVSVSTFLIKNLKSKGDVLSFNIFQAVDFKEFWGEKSEMRRFQDGSICEAVLWPGKTVAEKRLTCGHVIKHVLQRFELHCFK